MRRPALNPEDRGHPNRTFANCVLTDYNWKAMIFFDLDGTLLDHAEAERRGCVKFAHTFGLSGLDDGSFVSRWQEVSERYMDRYLAGELSFEDQRRLRLQDVLGRNLTEPEAAEIFQVYLDGYELSWRLYDDVLPCLDRLTGTQLGIITNGNREQQLKKLVSTSLLSRFAVIVTSEDAGVSKPDPRIFENACSQAGIVNNHCTYVGDRLESDALAATQAGLRGVWLDRSNSAAFVTTRVEVIGTLDDLMTL